jgi:hypothetical protein
MKWEEKQKKIEEYTFDTIEDIAEEIGVDIPFYPEVYWVGNKLKFEDLGISLSNKEVFENLKEKKSSIYLTSPKIILINGYFLEDIAEEAGHFLHKTSSNLKLTEVKTANDFCMHSIVEMFGFFCSKLIKPSTKNQFKKYKDYLSKESLRKKPKIRIEKIFGFSYNGYEIDSEVHQQGYGLGEELFNAYISEVVPMKKIRKLFKNDLSKKDEPLETFLGLKYDFINYLNNC